MVDHRKPVAMDRSKALLQNKQAANRGISEKFWMDEHINNMRSLKFRSKANIHFR